MKSSELRKQFLEYFSRQNHTIVPSSSLVPTNDPSLLFTNAGMVQFKEMFLGLEQRPYVRAATAQRCVRAGGKHNDLENVGYTARHHTFFEMLGNFSFGDYFKREAIHYAWDFLTRILKIPAEKLWITVFHEDHEAEAIWLNEIKINPQRLSRCGEKDNFWAMGDTGPCGPCSEIFYDHGSSILGGPPGSPDADGDRYIEIWNLVFMQYERNTEGLLTPLPKPSVDTGMGLERIAAVLQGVHNNYEIDLFHNLLQEGAQIMRWNDIEEISLRVLADHIRSCAFLILDGVSPSNEGRGYVLRRIIRRAIRHGYKLNSQEAFFYLWVAPLVNEMGEAYPALKQAQALIEQTIKREESQFANTLSQGMKLLEQVISNLSTPFLPGETIFRLYDTYGFPPDLTGDIARERNIILDSAGFEREMAKQRQLSKSSHKFSVNYDESVTSVKTTEFVGYECLESNAKITAIFRKNGEPLNVLHAGEEGLIVLDHTPFYAESGGQVGDKGYFYHGETIFTVHDTQTRGSVSIHQGVVEKGCLHSGNEVLASVDRTQRYATMANHTATHLLHAALRQVLGIHVFQKGSLVEANRLRFDFTHPAPLSSGEIIILETLVNQKIRDNMLVETCLMSSEQAKQSGAMALFDEKYGEQVRVLQIAEFSKELCGGTHVKRTGDIGFFKIVAETSVAAGIRRLEAITGQAALDWVNQMNAQLENLSHLLKVHPGNFSDKIIQLLNTNRELERNIVQLKAKLADVSPNLLRKQAIVLKEDIYLLAAEVPEGDNRMLLSLVDQFKTQLGKAIIVLGTAVDDKLYLVAGVTENLTDRLRADTLVNYVARQVGGKGGGRADMAQAGGNQPSLLKQALSSVNSWIQEQLGL